MDYLDCSKGLKESRGSSVEPLGFSLAIAHKRRCLMVSYQFASMGLLVTRLKVTRGIGEG